MPVFTAAATAIVTAAGLTAGTTSFLVATSVVAAGLAYGVGKLTGAFDEPDLGSFDFGEVEDPGVEARLGANTQNTIPALYGEWMERGRINYFEVSEDRQKLHTVITLGEGPATSIDRIYVDEFRVTLNASGHVTAATAPDGTTTDRFNSGRLIIHTYLGGANNRSTYLEGESTAWTSAHRMTGLVYAVVTVNYNRDHDVTGLPDIRFIGTSPNSNPADAVQDQLTNTIYGLGLPATDIDSTSFAAARTYFDSDVSYTNNAGNAATAKRFQVNGSVNTADSVQRRIESILDGCNASLRWSRGLWGIFVNRVDTTQAFNFNTSNIIGSINVTETGFNNLINKVQIDYGRNENNNWQRNTTILESPAGVRYPNEQTRQATLNLPLLATDIEAKRLGTLLLNQSRQQLAVRHRADATAMPLEAGDVVTYTDSDYGWVNKEFRIVSTIEIEEDGALTYDIEAVEYAAAVYDETLNEDDVSPNVNIRLADDITAVNDLRIIDTMPAATVPTFTIAWTVPSNSLIQAFDIFINSVSPTFNGRNTRLLQTVRPVDGNYAAGVQESFQVSGLSTDEYYFWVVGRNDFATSNASNTLTVDWQPSVIRSDTRTFRRFHENRANNDPGAPTGSNGTGGGWLVSSDDPQWQAVTDAVGTGGRNRVLTFDITGRAATLETEDSEVIQQTRFTFAGVANNSEVVTAARPSIAEYTFTGQSANLGVASPGSRGIYEIEMPQYTPRVGDTDELSNGTLETRQTTYDARFDMLGSTGVHGSAAAAQTFSFSSVIDVRGGSNAIAFRAPLSNIVLISQFINKIVEYEMVDQAFFNEAAIDGERYAQAENEERYRIRLAFRSFTAPLTVTVGSNSRVFGTQPVRIDLVYNTSIHSTADRRRTFDIEYNYETSQITSETTDGLLVGAGSYTVTPTANSGRTAVQLKVSNYDYPQSGTNLTPNTLTLERTYTSTFLDSDLSSSEALVDSYIANSRNPDSVSQFYPQRVDDVNEIRLRENIVEEAFVTFPEFNVFNRGTSDVSITFADYLTGSGIANRGVYSASVPITYTLRYSDSDSDSFPIIATNDSAPFTDSEIVATIIAGITQPNLTASTFLRNGYRFLRLEYDSEHAAPDISMTASGIFGRRDSGSVRRNAINLYTPTTVVQSAAAPTFVSGSPTTVTVRDPGMDSDVFTINIPSNVDSDVAADTVQNVIGAALARFTVDSDGTGVLTATSIGNITDTLNMTVGTGTNASGQSSNNNLAISKNVTQNGLDTDVTAGRDASFTLTSGGIAFDSNVTIGALDTDDIAQSIATRFDRDSRYTATASGNVVTVNNVNAGPDSEPRVSIDPGQNASGVDGTLAVTTNVVSSGIMQVVIAGTASRYVVTEDGATVISRAITSGVNDSDAAQEIADSLLNQLTDYGVQVNGNQLVFTSSFFNSQPDLNVTISPGVDSEGVAATLGITRTITQSGSESMFDLTDATWDYFVITGNPNVDTDVLNVDTDTNEISVRRGLIVDVDSLGSEVVPHDSESHLTSTINSGSDPSTFVMNALVIFAPAWQSGTASVQPVMEYSTDGNTWNRFGVGAGNGTFINPALNTEGNAANVGNYVVATMPINGTFDPQPNTTYMIRFRLILSGGTSTQGIGGWNGYLTVIEELRAT